MMEDQLEYYEEEEQWEEIPFASEEEEPAATLPAAERPQVTFMGNNYDLASLAAVITAAILMLMCVSCNMGFYCLPVIPLVLGIGESRPTHIPS